MPSQQGGIAAPTSLSCRHRQQGVSAAPRLLQLGCLATHLVAAAHCARSDPVPLTKSVARTIPSPTRWIATFAIRPVLLADITSRRHRHHSTPRIGDRCVRQLNPDIPALTLVAAILPLLAVLLSISCGGAAPGEGGSTASPSQPNVSAPTAAPTASSAPRGNLTSPPIDIPVATAQAVVRRPIPAPTPAVAGRDPTPLPAISGSPSPIAVGTQEPSPTADSRSDGVSGSGRPLGIDAVVSGRAEP